MGKNLNMHNDAICNFHPGSVIYNVIFGVNFSFLGGQESLTNCRYGYLLWNSIYRMWQMPMMEGHQSVRKSSSSACVGSEKLKSGGKVFCLNLEIKG